MLPVNDFSSHDVALASAAVPDVGGRVLPRLPSGHSPAITRVIKLLRQVARHDSNVLVLGESGTGKEVVARAIHDCSPRRRRPFVAVNCGAIPSELLESELFGHEKGAFTGAFAARKGRFEIAEGGTIFLDEIGDMSLAMQVKLLRVLQERVFERVGNQQLMACNVRIIAATHRNLDEAIERGQFRGDLFYRLNVFPIEMPPVRERIDDLSRLIEEFVELNAKQGRSRLTFSDQALRSLQTYDWPGNVRELANLIERLSILCEDATVRVADLPSRYRNSDLPVEAEDVPPCAVVREEAAGEFGGGLSEQEVCSLLQRDPNEISHQLPAQGLDLRAYIATIESSLINQALQRAGGTVAHAARLLGLRRTTLVEKLRKLGLDDEVPTES